MAIYTIKNRELPAAGTHWPKTFDGADSTPAIKR